MPYLGVRPADITSATEAEIAGDLTVDTNTLHVDAANNRVGVGTVSPVLPLEVNGSTNVAVFRSDASNSIIQLANSTGTGGDNGTLVGSVGDHLYFRAGDSEKGRFLSSGGLTFNGDTAAANALDDYEEGTFTPSYTQGTSSATYSIQTGRYTKVGRRVHFDIELDGNSITGNTSHLYIGGLPFTSTSSTPTSGCFLTYTGGVASTTHVTGVIFNGQTYFGVYKYSDGGSVAGNTMSLNGGWRWAGFYDV